MPALIVLTEILFALYSNLIMPLRLVVSQRTVAALQEDANDYVNAIQKDRQAIDRLHMLFVIHLLFSDMPRVHVRRYNRLVAGCDRG